VRLKMSAWMGSLLNRLGAPGFVRQGRYTGHVMDVSVEVRHSALYTVVSVNGVDVYFHRVTGIIDGVGVSQASDCMPSDTFGSRRFDGQHGTLELGARIQSESGHASL